jgi:hypothetical protein
MILPRCIHVDVDKKQKLAVTAATVTFIIMHNENKLE